MKNIRDYTMTALFITPVALLVPVVSCVAPRVMAPFFIGFGLLSIIAQVVRERHLPRFDVKLSILLLLTLAWGATSYFWTLSQDNTVTKLEQLLGVFAVLAFWKREAEKFTIADFQLIGRFLFAGLAAGFALYCFEWAGFKRFALYDLIRHGYSIDPLDSRQNKPIVLLALWCGIIFPYVWLSGKKTLSAVYAILVAAVAVATYYSPSSSAIMTMIAVGLLTALVRIIKRPHLCTMLITLGMIALSFGMLPGARAIALETSWYYNKHIPNSIEARLEIWDQAARRIMEKPFAGWGLDASPFLPNRGEHLISEPRYTIAHLHPHNAPLQIWFELGLVGMALLSALLMIGGNGILRMQSALAQNYAIVLFSQIFLYTLSIWGIWQTWFVSTLCFAGVMTYAGARYISLRQAEIKTGA